VTKREDVEALVRGTVDKYGRIDAIVKQSGIMPIAPMAPLKVEEWDRMIDVNIKASYMRWPQCFRSCKSKSWPHHQHRFCRGLQSLRAGRHRLQRDEVRRAGAD